MTKDFQETVHASTAAHIEVWYQGGWRAREYGRDDEVACGFTREQAIAQAMKGVASRHVVVQPMSLPRRLS